MGRLGAKHLIFGLLLIVVSSGCTDGNNGHDDLRKFAGTAQVLQECYGTETDVCALFDCMVDMCWCGDSGGEIPVLYETDGVLITSEGEAEEFVGDFLAESSTYEGYTVTRAVAINNIFYNVFSEDENSDEEVFTLAIDGTIIRTVCGV